MNGVQRVARLELDTGQVLHDLVQAYRLEGELNADADNLVLVFHSLTGSPETFGGWGGSLVGAGKAIDTRRYAVLCANLLGSCYGTSGPREIDPFPRVTPRDQARLTQLLLDELGVRSVALAIGGSLGGMVALEWAVQNPELVRSLAVFAAPAAHSAHAIAWNHIQRSAIAVGGRRGLALARMVGMMNYRTADEQARRFGRHREADGQWAVAAYLEHHGRALRRRFCPASYVALTHAMDAHDVGRGRGGVAAALAPLAGRCLGVGIPGDLLYPAEEVRAWTDAAGAEYRELRSARGHDGFLLELDQVSRLVVEALVGSAPVAAGGGA
jgi:homoserine O-acetyltransferase